MLVVASGPPSCALADWAARATGEQLWISCDLPPPDGAQALVDQPPNALLALSERFAHPDPQARLEITALDGFGRPPTRAVAADDHTEATAAVSRDIVNRRTRHDLIVLSTLSGFLDDAATRLLVSSPGSDRSIDAARQIAASAACHLCWNLARAGRPVIALCWDVEKTLKGKVVGETAGAPRRLLAMADLVIHLDGGNATVVSARDRLALAPGSTLDGWGWMKD